METVAQLDHAVPAELADELIKRIPYISEGIRDARLLPGSKDVAFRLLPGWENRSEMVASHISQVAGKLCLNYRPARLKTLAKREVPPSAASADPHPSLLEEGEIEEFGRGRYGLGPKLCRLMEYLDSSIRRLAMAAGASARSFPSLVGADVLDRCRYMKNFPTSLTFVSHLPEDYALQQEFAKSIRWDGEPIACQNRLTGIECLLSPCVCFNCYMSLRDSVLSNPRAFTAAGKCFRYESSNLSGLERLWEFTMREIIFVGSLDYVLAQKRALTEASAAFLDELEIGYEITTAADPFFVDNFVWQAAHQTRFDLKFELLVPLHYCGKKIAVGSINHHQDFFGRAFAIRLETGDAAHTACVGFGYERLMLAFLAQHGTDARNWPTAVTRGLGAEFAANAHA